MSARDRVLENFRSSGQPRIVTSRISASHRSESRSRSRILECNFSSVHECGTQSGFVKVLVPYKKIHSPGSSPEYLLESRSQSRIPDFSDYFPGPEYRKYWIWVPVRVPDFIMCSDLTSTQICPRFNEIPDANFTLSRMPSPVKDTCCIIRICTQRKVEFLRNFSIRSDLMIRF